MASSSPTACLALAALVLVGACGPGDERRELDTRAVVIGIDGADWKLVDELAAQGRMPNLARLRERGVWGRIETLADIPLSPVIWTSVATGKTAAKHGVTWFLVDQPDGTRVPVQSTNRKTEALWTIADRHGLHSAVVGWWASYPAEPLEHGVIVSDALGFHGFGSTSRGGAERGKTHPSELFARVDALVPPEQQVSLELVQRFVHIGAEDYRAEMFDPARFPRRNPQNPIHLFQQYAVTAQGYTRIAEDLLSDEHELFLLYYEQVDSFSHLFMKYDPPKLAWIDDAGFERYRDVVRAWYRYQDELLGRVLAKIDIERTAVFVLSDHGFKSGERRIQSDKTVDVKKAHLDHETHGIFVAAGPHVRRGAEVVGASVLDLTPTVLHYLGLAVAKDMDGKVLEQVFEPAFRERHPIRYVATYEDGRRERTAQADAVAAAGGSSEAEEGLRALGYLGDAGDDDPVAAAGTDGPPSGTSSPEMHNNLGRIHLRNGEPELALAEFQKALERDPKNAEALLNIGTLHQRQGRTAQAQHFAERALQVDPSSVGALAQLAEVRRDQDKLDDAIRLFREALALEDSQPALFLGLGDVLQRARRFDEAEQAFQSVLALEPDSFKARYNLGVTYANMGRKDDAEAQYELALAIDRKSPEAALALNNLGALRLARRDVERALAAFEEAVRASPFHLESRYNAGLIHLDQGRVDEAIVLLEQAVALQPNHELISLRLGTAYLRAGRNQDAFRSFLLVRRLYPSNWAATLGLAALHAGAGEAERARSLYAEALKLGGDDARAFAASFPALAGLGG